MALYRTVSTSFWTDPKVLDEFTPEDRYFYLYLFTNPHTNLCGCYEISLKQVATETGYGKETVENLLDRFERIHGVVKYSFDTKEILLLNWHKYNWTSSEKYRKPLLKEIKQIKHSFFKQYLTDVFNGTDTPYPIDTVSIPYGDPMDTSNSISITNTDTIFDNVPVEIKSSFMDWVQMRKEMKRPITTKTGVSEALKELNQLSQDPQEQNEIISYCIFRSWMSFYPKRKEQRSNRYKEYEKEKKTESVPMPKAMRKAYLGKE